MRPLGASRRPKADSRSGRADEDRLRRRQSGRRLRVAGLLVTPDLGRDKRSQALPCRPPDIWAAEQFAAHNFCMHCNISEGIGRDVDEPTHARKARSHDCEAGDSRPPTAVEPSALFARALKFQHPSGRTVSPGGGSGTERGTGLANLCLCGGPRNTPAAGPYRRTNRPRLPGRFRRGPRDPGDAGPEDRRRKR